MQNNMFSIHSISGLKWKKGYEIVLGFRLKVEKNIVNLYPVSV